MRGSFSAVSTATIATKYSFFRIFEIYKISILLHRSDLKISRFQKKEKKDIVKVLTE